MYTTNQLGGPLTVVDDVSNAIAELRDTIRRLTPRVESALDAVPRVEENIDTLTGYMPWIIGSIGFLGMAIIIHGIKTARQ